MGESILVDYHVTGGLAGLDQTLIVCDDGSAVVFPWNRGRHDYQLTDQEQQRLADHLKQANLKALSGKKFPSRRVSDALHMIVRSKGSQVQFSSGDDVPSELTGLTGFLGGILQAQGGA